MVGKRTKKPVCEFCDTEFTPNYRNGSRQRYCCKAPECRAASKAASQKAWLSKPENQDYFRGPEQVKRVQDWRRKKKPATMPESDPAKEMLQDDCSGNHLEKHVFLPPSPPGVLQDDWMQHPVIVGMVAWLTKKRGQVLYFGKKERKWCQVFYSCFWAWIRQALRSPIRRS